MDGLFLILVTCAAFLVFGAFYRIARNPLVRRKLWLSLLILALAFLLELIDLFTIPIPRLEGKLEILGQILGGWAVISSIVALLFNPLKQESTPDRFPGIVQDTIVVASFVLIATLIAPEQLFTTSAIGALVLGLALQDTLGNLFAGLAIQIEKPFQVGDWVGTGRHEGRVVEVTWRATKIRTKSGIYVIIPNNLVAKEMLVNYSRPSPVNRIEQVIGLGYEAHPNLVKQVILDTIAEVPEALKNPPPDVLLSSYDDFAISYRCRFWINDFGLSDPILDRFSTLLYYRLKRAGLVVPFPVRDVRLAERAEQAAAQPDDSSRKQRFVEAVDLFANLESEDKSAIARALDRVVFGSGETIIRQGEAGDSMFFIRSGRVRILLQNPEGGTEQIARLSDGQFFGEMALLTGEARTATVVADGDLEAYVLRKDAFRDVLLGNPEIARIISRVVMDRKKALASRKEKVEHHEAHVENELSFLGRIQAFFRLGA